MSEPFDKTAYIERVMSLRAPPPLTEGLNLSAADKARVSEAVAAVKSEGYAIYRDFLDADTLADLRTKLASIFEMTGQRTGGRHGGVQTVHVHNLFAKTDAVDRFAIDSRLLHLIEGVLGPQFQLSVATAMCPQPGVDPQGLHQDDGHFPLPRPRPPFIANTLIALDDFSEQNGATRLVPGTHVSLDPVDPEAEVVYAEMPAGSLLVFDGALWHAGGGNRSKDQQRRSINLNFNLSWLRQQENQYVGIPRARWLTMPEKLQRLLGFQKVNFLYGSVDYTDPLTYFLQHDDALG